MNTSGRSLYTYLGVIIVSVVIAVITAHAVVFYFSAKEDLEKKLRIQVEERIIGLQTSIARYIEAYAVNEYEKLIETEMINYDFLAIVVSDYNMGAILGQKAYQTGKVRDELWNLKPFNPRNQRHHLLLEERCFMPVSASILSQSGEEIGRIMICNSDRSLQQTLRQTVYANISYAVSISALLVILLFFSIRRFVLAPVDEMAKRLQYNGSSELPAADMPVDGAREISILGSSINDLITIIHDRENKLRLSEARFRSLVENMPAMVFLKDAERLRYELLNSAGEKLLGYSRGELIGKSDYDLFEQEQADFFTSKDREVLLHHDVVEIHEEPVTISDGKTKYLKTFKTGIYDQQGQPTHLLGISLDITEKKQSEAKALKLTQALEQSGEAVTITDAEGNIEFVNKAFCILTGYPQEEVIGKTPRILKSGLHSADYYRDMWDALESRGTWQGRIKNRKKDGSVYPALLTISAITNDQDEIINHLGIQRDLTELEELENKFHQAQKMEAVGTLVGGIAHDFNNMLAGITGNLYLLGYQVADKPEAIQQVETIETLAFRAADMIKRLLTFSRNEHVEMQVISIGLFIKDFLKLHRVSVPENIALEASISDPSLLIDGNVTQLQQVMLNLINNARDALAETEQPEITISVEGLEVNKQFMQKFEWLKSSHLAKICVSDNGSGIAQKDLEHICEPFFTTKEVGKGTGLGMAMVYGAVRAHGGAIDINSTQGEGTSIDIYLPIVEKAFNNNEDIGDEKSFCRGHGETILLTDDNRTVRDSTRDVLQNLGYHVVTAENGRKAIELFSEQPDEIKLLIFDVVMPDMGGVEALQAIRDIRPEIGIIFATGYGADSNLNTIKNAEVIYKPFKYRALARKIHDHLITTKMG